MTLARGVAKVLPGNDRFSARNVVATTMHLIIPARLLIITRRQSLFNWAKITAQDASHQEVPVRNVIPVTSNSAEEIPVRSTVSRGGGEKFSVGHNTLSSTSWYAIFTVQSVGLSGRHTLLIEKARETLAIGNQFTTPAAPKADNGTALRNGAIPHSALGIIIPVRKNTSPSSSTSSFPVGDDTIPTG